MAGGRPPSAPPELPNYSYERLLGSGGFADVFLYTQHLPRRQVAVKVLLSPTTDDASREQFVAEANLMAQLSTHPSIVTIYHADTAGDGRPYLVMEYCPLPNLSARYRAERLSVAESLRIGVRLGGAVETAHRAGILHRDIKPANVLTTDYGWPALTDFGISVVQHAVQDAEAVGMSIPWSAPEFFGEDVPRGVEGDIYALSATVYTLLAGRSPFEQGGGRNSALDLIKRIERDPVPPLNRDDVPPSLELALRRGMAKKPEARFGSAAEFARALQRVEQELYLAQTALDLPDTSWIQVPDAVGEDLRTRVRAVVEITPTSSVTAAGEATHVARPQFEAPADTTGPEAPAPDRPRRRWLTIAASALVVFAVAGVVVYGAMNASTEPPEPVTTTDAPPPPSTAAPLTPPPVEDLQGERSEDDPGTVRFTWTAPEFDGDLEYIWHRSREPGATRDRISEQEVVLTDVPDRVCVEVAVISSRSNRLSEPVEACA